MPAAVSGAWRKKLWSEPYTRLLDSDRNSSDKVTIPQGHLECLCSNQTYRHIDTCTCSLWGEKYLLYDEYGICFCPFPCCKPDSCSNTLKWETVMYLPICTWLQIRIGLGLPWTPINCGSFLSGLFELIRRLDFSCESTHSIPIPSATYFNCLRHKTLLKLLNHCWR